ncbi:MAG: phosphoribosylformylglycinamidine synthase [Firmicutes bacterium]|nr:phosphoribosylformylglycinamidine synthase [Bacillota bacterium]
MNNQVYRIYVEKKPEFAPTRPVIENIRTHLQITALQNVRIIERYDVQGLDAEDLAAASATIFAEPPVDNIYDTLPDVPGARIFATEFLPGQYDQRADSCSQSIQLLTQKERPLVRYARVYILEGDLTDEDVALIKASYINPVESREASLEPVATLTEEYPEPADVAILDGFRNLDDAALEELRRDLGLAMDFDDIAFCRSYFTEEGKDPSITEIRLIDTYWSDHCRHTTFLTTICDPEIEADYMQKSYDKYLHIKAELGRQAKPICLMDIGTIAARHLKAAGILQDLDESEEINACSVRVKVEVDGAEEDWLLMFKNETHNHPTEIEPFGGAATCLGGAIRDPLSGRVYVYQAMRVTGAADPLVPLSETLPGKLPQKKIVTTAAAGYSSYGNQIGLATGLVNEIYHPGYMAKRMEIGAVIGAAPAENVVRERPAAGDVIILLGGSTGRDGCGGATGSSKSHTAESLLSCGAEVQKGNPLEERKIQRLFRDPAVTRMIKRCNDFGAGGVSVAIGELADGLMIDLDKVPKKYEGLDGTELAISESQERMAVVVAAADEEKFLAAALAENLQAVKVADVVSEPRMRMTWRGRRIVDLSRDFLNSNGAPKHTEALAKAPDLNTLPLAYPAKGKTRREQFLGCMADLNVCSQKGLVERFDSTIGAGTVTMPYGGARQLTPTPYMAAKLPVLKGETDTTSLMAYGFEPYLSAASPYHGAMYAVVDSVARLAAAGLDYKRLWLTFQEYFPKLGQDKERWGLPLAALLGALEAQLELGLAAIGGKDSMSGSFENIDVPPTLVSFAVGVRPASRIVTPEFKHAGDKVWLLKPAYTAEKTPDFASLRAVFDAVYALADSGSLHAAQALGYGGIAEAVTKMCFGNNVGFAFNSAFTAAEDIFAQNHGAILLELPADTEAPAGAVQVGVITEATDITINGETIPLADLLAAWQGTLESVFPTAAPAAGTAEAFSYTERATHRPQITVAHPRVLLPLFPGTNCEYDTARQFERYGAITETCVIGNLTQSMVEDSVDRLEAAIRRSQIVMLPGGFSGGDEPDGSGKFIAAFFRNPRLKEAIMELLQKRDGLMLGICNGFQALIKLGLLPYGEICDMKPDSPTLTFNNIGRHQSMLVQTRIASVKSPWLAYTNVGDLHTIAVSHGEGKFVAGAADLQKLRENGQICMQYVDLAGNPTMQTPANPNGSVQAIEGICSPDGRILGKMGHSERAGSNIFKNVPGNKEQYIFKAGVDYFAR